MAAKKGGNSTKTAHVLNMISGAGTANSKPDASQQASVPAVPDGESPPGAVPQAASTQRPLPPVLEFAKSNDQALSNQIQSALEAELASAIGEPTVDLDTPAQEDALITPLEVPSLEPTSESSAHLEPPSPGASSSGLEASIPDDAVPDVSESATPAEAPPADPDSSVSGTPAPAAPESNMQHEAQTVGEEDQSPPGPEAQTTPSQDPASSAPLPFSNGDGSVRALDGDLLYVNVMQILVEEKAERYIKMFGLCDCPRCTIDVKALALSNLPAKYVVMRRGQASPMLAVYENRFNTAVIAQIMNACKAVMESPRH